MEKEVLHIYVRVSGDKSAKKDNSIPAQEAEGKRIASMYNMEYKIYREGDTNTGTSATKDDLTNRPVLQNLLDLCDDGIVKHIFYTESDRVVRNEVIHTYIKKVYKRNGVKVYSDGKVYDISNNDEDEFMSDLMSILSQREIRIKNKRIKRSLEESAKKGKWGGGVMLPYGFRRQAIQIVEEGVVNKIESGILEFHPEESKIVQNIYNLSLQGKGSASIAKILNEAGIPTRGRKSLKNGIKLKDRLTGEKRIIKPENIMWKPGTILGILKNPLFKGERHYKESIFQIESLIDPNMWQGVQDNLKKNNINSQRNNKTHFYMLKGLLVCGKCGKGLYGVIKPNRGMRIYTCVSKRSHECNMKGINIDRLNEVVWEDFKNSFLYLEKVIEQQGDGMEKVKTEELLKLITGLEKQIENRIKEQKAILILFGKGKITEARFDERDKELKEDIEKTQINIDRSHQELTFLQVKKSLSSSLRSIHSEVISELCKKTDEEKRDILKEYVKEILIDYDDSVSAHIIKAKFYIGDRINTLTPKVFTIPTKEKGWRYLGFGMPDGSIWKPENMEGGPIVTEPHR